MRSLISLVLVQLTLDKLRIWLKSIEYDCIRIFKSQSFNLLELVQLDRHGTGITTVIGLKVQGLLAFI